MPERHDNLFAGIANFQALLAAYRKAVTGKRRKPGAAAFTAGLETQLLRLQRELQTRTWRPGHYVEIAVRDPKPRIVSAAPFRDRVVHHALCAVVAPIFDRGFIFHSYANREGKGTHRAVDRCERWRDRHVLRCDINRYFPAIGHEHLKAAFRRGSRTLNTLIRGACATRSFATAGSIRQRIVRRRRGSLAVPRSPGLARRFLERQPEEPPRRNPQQERHGEPQRQHRFPPGQHASMPEPAGPWPSRARRG